MVNQSRFNSQQNWGLLYDHSIRQTPGIEENGFWHNLVLLFVSHQFCVSILQEVGVQQIVFINHTNIHKS